MNEKDVMKAQGTKALPARAAALFLAFALAFMMFGPVTIHAAYAGEEESSLETVQDEGQDAVDEGVVEESVEGEPESDSRDVLEDAEQQNATEEQAGTDARAGPETMSGRESDVSAEPAQVTVLEQDGIEAAQPQIAPLAVNEASCVVTFYSDVAERNPSILARLLVKAEAGQTAPVDTSAYTAQPQTAEQAFTGWVFDGAVHEGTIEIDPQDGNVNLYPAFATGHWLRFSVAADSSDATSVASQFVAATAEAPDTLPISQREGYAFDGWHEGQLIDGQVVYGEQVSDAQGAVLQPLALKDKLLAGDVELHAKWTGLPSSYRVFLWYENPDDDGYTYEETLVVGDDESESVVSGQMTSDTYLPAREGFSVQEVESRVVAGDGSTVVNAYYDRNVYSVYFHQERLEGSAVFSELTITAKYGADIHGLWPQQDDPDGRYTTSWYTLTDTSSNVFVTGIGTMPLNGDDFYPKLDTGVLCETVYRIQAVDGSDSYDEYVSVPFTTANSPWTTADDYVPIKGFMVNAASDGDAALIRENQVGDKLATHDGGYLTSAAIDSRYEDAPLVEGSDGQQRHTLYFYYLRCQYDVVFEENGGSPVPDAKGIYYEGSLAGSAPESYVEGQTSYTAQNGMTYTFAGWYDNEVLTGQKFDFANERMPAGNVVLYAKWEPARYLVQLDPDGGEFVDPAQSTYFWVEHGNAIGPVDAERHYVLDPNGQYGYDYETEGTDTDDFGQADYVTVQDGYDGERYSRSENAYTLFGWYLAETDEPYDMNAPVTHDTNLVAKWRSAGMFNIAYNPVMSDESAVVSGDIDTRLDDGYADLSPTFVMNTPDNIVSTTGDSYEFVGWQVVSSFDEDAVVLDDTLYLEGDGFIVDSELAYNNTIHLQAVYNAIDSPTVPEEVSPGTIVPSVDGEQSGGTSSGNVSSDVAQALFPKTADMAKILPMAITTLSLAALGVALLARMMRKRHARTLDEDV